MSVNPHPHLLPVLEQQQQRRQQPEQQKRRLAARGCRWPANPLADGREFIFFSEPWRERKYFFFFFASHSSTEFTAVPVFFSVHRPCAARQWSHHKSRATHFYAKRKLGPEVQTWKPSAWDCLIHLIQYIIIFTIIRWSKNLYFFDWTLRFDPPSHWISFFFNWCRSSRETTRSTKFRNVCHTTMVDLINGPATGFIIRHAGRPRTFFFFKKYQSNLGRS